MNTTTQHTQRPVEAKRRAAIAGVLALLLAGPVLAQERLTAKVRKDPSCGCCKDWITHMEQAGFEVQVFDSGNNAARARLGIAQKFGSCHTAQIGRYAIEGHVPAADIRRLLREAPRAIGLAAPGMPVGSPGMDGPVYGDRKDAYDVLLLTADGKSTVFQSHR